MRIAHISDLHLLNLEGAVPFRLLNKRLTGYLNLRFHRKSVHKPFVAQAAARAIQDLGIDHVVVTGDITNLALQGEFETALAFLSRELGLDPSRVSLVPGNHDAYTAGAHRTRRFSQYFADFVASDLPDVAAPGSAFPFVRLRGPVAIVGLSTAVPRPPLVASGKLGPDQLEAFARLLEHREVRDRTLVVLQHHPLHNPPSLVKSLLEGLADAPAEQSLLRGVERGLVLHGHLHRRVRRELGNARGTVEAIGATSASLIHATDERMGGFNVYAFDERGAVEGSRSFALDPERDTFREVRIPSA